MVTIISISITRRWLTATDRSLGNVAGIAKNLPSRYGVNMFKQRRHTLASIVTTLMLTACASPNHADSLYINTMISGELMPGVYGQVNIGSVPDYVTIYDEPTVIAPPPIYAAPLEPIYLYVPPYHAHYWRDYCGYYNACTRPVFFVCAHDYRPHYFEPSYYNTRVYNPPRVYYSHQPAHSRHYETMHQPEINRDPYFHGRNAGNRGSYYPQHDNRDDNTHWQQQNHRDDNSHRGDNDRQQHEHRDDHNSSRQQFINNYRNDGNRNNGNGQQLVRQPYNNNAQPPQNEVTRTRIDNNLRGSDFRREVHPVSYRQSSGNNPQMHGHDQAPRQQPMQQQPQQPSFRAQGQGGFNRHQNGGRDERQHEDRR